MLPSANQKGSGVCAGTSKWIPSGTSAAKAVIAFAAFTAALKRRATQKKSATQRFTANLHPEALPKNRFPEFLPRIFTPSRHRETDPAAMSALSWRLCRRSARDRVPQMDILDSYGTVSSAVFTIFRKNSRQAIVLSVGADHSYIAILRSAASAGSLSFLAIDPALSSTK
jgi:hypothetical protein